MTSHIIHLEAGEEIVLEVRRHIIVLYASILALVLLFFAPLILSPFVIQFLNFLSGTGGGALLFGFLMNLWLLVLFIAFFFQWTDYYLDVWVITTRRIFDIEQKGVFRQEVSVFRFDQIQDMTVHVTGIVASLFKFGDIHVHTAGQNADLVIRQARRPMDVKNLIITLQSGTGQKVTSSTSTAPLS